MNLVTLEHVAKQFSERVLLDDVELRINAGERIGLIGINGSGKITELRIVAGLETPDAGTVTVWGGARITYLPQEPALDDAHTVIESVYAGEAPQLALRRDFHAASRHLADNLRSRWTDFLTTDGENPDRGREREFLDEPGGERAAIMARWDESWRIVFATLDALAADDLGRTITIRGEPHCVLQAIQRNLLHTTHHVGQIDLLASALPGNRTVGTMMAPPVGQQITFLYTAELAATARFSEVALGLALALDQGDCRIYRVSGDGLLGFCQRAEVPHAPAGIIVTLVTDDVDGWFARLSWRGVAFDQPPARNPQYAIYHRLLCDPNGYLVEIQRFE